VTFSERICFQKILTFVLAQDGTVIVCRGDLDVLVYLTFSQPEKLPSLAAVSRVGVVVIVSSSGAAVPF
jgi:hypothetical protein